MLKKKGVYTVDNWLISSKGRYWKRDSDAKKERSLYCIVTDRFLPLVDIEKETVMLKKKGVYIVELLIDFFLW